MLGTLGDYRGCINLARREFDSANKTMINAWAGSGLEWPAPPPTPLLPSHRGFSLLNIPTLSQGSLSPQHSYPLTGLSLSSTFFPFTGISHASSNSPPTLSQGFLSPQHSSLSQGFLMPPQTPLLPSHRGFSLLTIPTLSQGFLSPQHSSLSQGFLMPPATPLLPSHRAFSLLNIPTLSQAFLSTQHSSLSQGFLMPPQTPLLPSHRGFSLLTIPTLSQGFLSPQHSSLSQGFLMPPPTPSYPLTGVSLSSTFLPSHRRFSLLNILPFHRDFSCLHQLPPTLSQGSLSPQHSYPLTGVSLSSPFLPSHRGFSLLNILPFHRDFSCLHQLPPTLSQGSLSPQHSYPLTGVSLSLPFLPSHRGFSLLNILPFHRGFSCLHKLPSYPLTGVSLSSTFVPFHRGSLARASTNTPPTLLQGFLSPQHSYPLTVVSGPRLHQLLSYHLTEVSPFSTFLPSHRRFLAAPTPIPSYPLTGVSPSSPFLPSHRGFSLLNMPTLLQGFLAHASTNSPPTLSQVFSSIQQLPSYPLTGVSPSSTFLPSHRGFSPQHSYPLTEVSYPLTGVSLFSTFLPSHGGFSLLNIPTLSQGFLALSPKYVFNCVRLSQ